MRPLVGVFVLLSTTAAAQTQDKNSGRPTPSDQTEAAGVETKPPKFSFLLETGAGALILDTPQMNLRQMRLAVSPGVLCYQALFIAPSIQLTRVDVRLHRGSGLPFDTDAELPWQPAVGLLVGLSFMKIGPVYAALGGNITFPIGTSRVIATAASSRDMLVGSMSPQELIRDHANASVSWYSAAGTLMLGTDIGRWHPYVDLGVLSMKSLLTLEFDQAAAEAISPTAPTNRLSYGGASTDFFYDVGSTFDLTKKLSLRVNASVWRATDLLFVVMDAGLSVALPY
ncbi:MAG: hypothetical protein WCT10_04475 [Patescibacteria group bacterium]|jgi:hypothetical protein